MNARKAAPDGGSRRSKAKAVRRKRRSEKLYYVVEIEDWDWSFMFGVSPFKDRREGPYSDYRHLELKGKLLRPASVKTSRVEIALLPDVHLNEPMRDRDQPRSAGSFHIVRGFLQFTLPIPADALSDVLAMMVAGRFRCAVIEADRPSYGQGFVRFYRLATTIDDDDLLPDA